METVIGAPDEESKLDTFSRFSPAIKPQFNFRGADVVEVLKESGER